MKKGLDIHNFEKKMESAFRCLDREELVSEYNKELIKKFVKHRILDGMSKARLSRYIFILRDWAKLIGKDFDKAVKEEIMDALSVLQNKDYSAWTLSTYKAMLKRFYKWINGNEELPDCVKWIKAKIDRKDRKVISPDELLTEGEIMQVLEIMPHPRDKAFVSLLYESGCRIGEIGNLQVKNVSFDENGAIINVNGKTGPRSVRIISSVSYLASWINCHPFKNDPESALWVNVGNANHGKVMKYQGIRMMLQRYFKRAGINKKINPHFFRHSRASLLANHLTEFQMNHYFGWIQGSDMPSTYIHMSGKRLDESLLEMNGMQKEEVKKESVLKPKKCLKCDLVNGPDAKFCSKCGGTFDLKTSLEVDEVKEKRTNADELMGLLMKDEKISKMILEKVKEIGITNSLM